MSYSMTVSINVYFYNFSLFLANIFSLICETVIENHKLSKAVHSLNDEYLYIIHLYLGANGYITKFMNILCQLM